MVIYNELDIKIIFTIQQIKVKYSYVTSYYNQDAVFLIQDYNMQFRQLKNINNQ